MKTKKKSSKGRNSRSPKGTYQAEYERAMKDLKKLGGLTLVNQGRRKEFRGAANCPEKLEKLQDFVNQEKKKQRERDAEINRDKSSELREKKENRRLIKEAKTYKLAREKNTQCLDLKTKGEFDMKKVKAYLKKFNATIDRNAGLRTKKIKQVERAKKEFRERRETETRKQQAREREYQRQEAERRRQESEDTQQREEVARAAAAEAEHERLKNTKDVDEVLAHWKADCGSDFGADHDIRKLLNKLVKMRDFAVLSGMVRKGALLYFAETFKIDLEIGSMRLSKPKGYLDNLKKEVRKRYKKAVFLFHPDRCDHKLAEEMFKILNNAHDAFDKL